MNFKGYFPTVFNLFALVGKIFPSFLIFVVDFPFDYALPQLPSIFLSRKIISPFPHNHSLLQIDYSLMKVLHCHFHYAWSIFNTVYHSIWHSWSCHIVIEGNPSSRFMVSIFFHSKVTIRWKKGLNFGKLFVEVFQESFLETSLLSFSWLFHPKLWKQSLLQEPNSLLSR